MSRVEWRAPGLKHHKARNLAWGVKWTSLNGWVVPNGYVLSGEWQGKKIRRYVIKPLEDYRGRV